MNVKKNKKGFTLMEMLIVVAIIAVLVAIAIPVLSNNLHKAKVAADWANVRAYYADLQAEYLTTGEIREGISDSTEYVAMDTLEFSNGTTAKLQAGICYVIWSRDTGKYNILYVCNDSAKGDHYTTCTLILGTT